MVFPLREYFTWNRAVITIIGTIPILKVSRTGSIRSQASDGRRGSKPTWKKENTSWRIYDKRRKAESKGHKWFMGILTMSEIPQISIDGIILARFLALLSGQTLAMSVKELPCGPRLRGGEPLCLGLNGVPINFPSRNDFRRGRVWENSPAQVMMGINVLHRFE